MKRVLAIALLSTVFFGTSAFAVEPVVGNWKLNVSASKFSGEAPKSVTRSYSESPDGTVLHQKMIGADGKEADMRVVTKLDGKDHEIEGNPDADTVAGTAVDARTSHFSRLQRPVIEKAKSGKRNSTGTRNRAGTKPK